MKTAAASVPVLLPDMLPPELQDLDAKVKALKIETPEGAEEARRLWKNADTHKKQITADLAEALKPHKAEIKVIQDKANVKLTLCENAIATLKTGILEYDTRLAEEQRQEQLRLNAEYLKQQEREEKKAERTGAPVRPLPPVPVVPTAPKTVAGVSTVEVTTWDILGVVVGGDPLPGADLTRANPDLKDVPDKYFVLQTGAITKIVKSGGDIPGVNTRKVKTLANRG